VARRTAKKSSRGAVPEDGSRIRNEVAAIALAAFAVLSLVALFVDANATVTHWWRSFLFTILGWGAFLVPVVLAALAAEMWFGLLRRAMAAPIGGGLVAYTAILALLQHIQHGDPATGNGAGGLLGSALDKIASGALGDVGGPIALVALFLVGVVIAANRTLAELARPAWERRDAVRGLRPGIALPGGTATRFVRADEDEEDGGPVAVGDDEPGAPLRINLPPERPKLPPRPSEASGKPQLRLLPPPGPAAPR